MAERYNRQIMIPEIGEEGQQKIRKAKVLLIGVGGLGSPIATYLTGAGIGKLGIVDDDVVDITNLHRQVLYSEEQTGQKKAECAKQRLRKLNSEVEIEAYPFRLTEENAEKMIQGYDIVVDGMDNFATRYIVSDVCERQNKPYVYGAIRAMEGQVAVLCKGERTYRSIFPDEQEMLQMPHPGKAVLGTTPAIVGSVQACQVLMLAAEFGSPLIDKLWTINLSTMDSMVIDL